MSISALSSLSTSPQLVKLASGEYSAASVNTDPKDAIKLGLEREKDGNYGAAPLAPASLIAQGASGMLSALTSLHLGGA
jgi:cytoplasmic iron level regulating protein YaaA (DUF328/UPF0246 family)